MSIRQIVQIANFVAVALLFATPSASAQDHSSGLWKIRRSEWTAQDEQKFAEFVAAIGNSNCKRATDCLMTAENPYRAKNPPDIRKAFSDCADWPYVLRLYFAYMNDLPFSYVSKVSAVGASRDIRYSANGNYATGRITIKNGANLVSEIIKLNNTISSAMFRMDPSRDVDAQGHFPDYYPVKLNRLNVGPGTVIYDPNGHVAIVYKVESDGRIRFMDAHPDNSVTRGTFGERFARSRPAAGAGFKNFRPIRISNSGVVSTRSNAQLPNFSVEQFFGTHPVLKVGTNQPDPTKWSQGKFVFKGQSVGYYDYLRFVLAEGELRFHPVEEFSNMLDSLCEDSGYRQASVEEAINNRIHLKSHPERLPENIYGTDGEWETYSTPSRDARLKTTFREARKRLEQFVQMHRDRDLRLDFAGNLERLKGDLLKTYDDQALSCKVSYQRSNGARVELNLEEFENRVFKMSFDPYHCVELRWGAEGDELASCADSSNKLQWYAAEQRLRNQIDRVYDVRMGFSLQDLINKVPGSGVDQAPVVDLRGFLLGL